MVQATNPVAVSDVAITQLLFAVVRRTHALAPREAGDIGALKLLLSVVEIGPARISDVAEEAHLDVSTASRHAANLESQKLVRRLADPDDRRAHLIEATPKARRHLEKMLESRADTLAPALSTWTDADRFILFELLQRLETDMTAELNRKRSTTSKDGS